MVILIDYSKCSRYRLTLLGLMEYSVKLDTVKSGWSIIYIEGSQVIISERKKMYFFLYSLRIDDEMSHNAAFHLGPHCLPKYPFLGFWS